ncbi:MAG: hypothetical protein A3A26_01970 [Candidatus Zambryskibacteria bacterium RIFCSPLOWO2_01_FULL_47_14]|uniref:PilN domain-containing protein n=1 Tax=Candidatus Zambryskibacteria bacterium RIFCSPLOWO2_01_FULL_47_14 TaxID=1802763 RepID=A0A1G2U784_9BACT|nr:MAG: hypothetical protein A3A26_01970 [Candidatus Zambryskibacteria bacterium RIFCSPLOWO2_01_FULL_47_14]
MPPKFESSFIPKGPTFSAGTNFGVPAPARKGERTLLGFIAIILFILSVVAAAGVLGYKFYLNYSIKNMEQALEAGRASLQTETVVEITRLNNRLLSAEALIDGHTVLSPVFRFLDSATLKDVRLTDFFYNALTAEPRVIIKGEARSYTALAQQAEFLKESDLFENPIFGDLRLDDEGNVEFSFEAEAAAGLLSYRREMEKLNTPTTNPSTGSTGSPQASSGQATTTTATSTATTTPRR